MKHVEMGLILFIAIVPVIVGTAPGAEMQIRPDILVDDFEREDYAPWTAEGEAFGPGPAQGTLPRQMEVTGYHGQRLVNSYYNGDGTVGVLTSPPFTLERHYLVFLIGGGGYPEETFMELVVDGQSVCRATGPNTAPGGSEMLDWTFWDVRQWEGKTAVIRIVDRRTGGWGHINVDYIIQTDQSPDCLLQPLETPVTHRYLLLPVAGKGPRTHCRIMYEGNIVRYFDIQLAEDDAETRFWASIDLQPLLGKKVSWDIRPARSGASSKSDSSKATRLFGRLISTVRPTDRNFIFPPAWDGQTIPTVWCISRGNIISSFNTIPLESPGVT